MSPTTVDARRADLRGRRVEHLRAPPGEHDRRPAARQLVRRRLAEPGAAAGDQRDLPVEQAGGEDLGRLGAAHRAGALRRESASATSPASR